MEEKKQIRAGIPPPPQFRFRPVSALFLVLALLLVYNSNLRSVRIDDSLPARLLPFSLLWDHNFYLDRWFPHILPTWYAQHIYFARKVRGHWLSAYPVILPVMLVPLYVLPAELLAPARASPTAASLLAPLVIDSMEKLSASLIAALSAGVLYLALRKKASPNVSLVIVLIYGLASNTFSTSSQALWRHGFTELCYAFLLWALWRDSTDTQRAFWAGLALGAATANKLADIALLLPFLLYFSRRSRKELVACLIPMSALGFLVLWYNLHFFGSILGGYPNPFIPPPVGPVRPAVQTPFWVGLAGLMISPSRGLLIYSPWVVFALWGAARMWKENPDGWERYLIVGMVITYALQAKLGQWWGGWCFGPRYMTDLLPFVAIFLLPVWSEIRASTMLRAALALAVGASLWVQVVGVYYYPRGQWDSAPVAVEYAPQRLWNWSDTQLSRTWRAGPARPELPFEWMDYFKRQAAIDGPPRTPQSPAP